MISPLWRQAVPLAILILAMGAPAQAQSDPGAGAPVAADFPPGVQDVVRMTRSGVSEDVILAQIKSASIPYHLTADQIITLTQDGVSQNVIQALVQSGTGAAGEIPPSSAQDTSEPSAAPPAPAGDIPDAADASVVPPPPAPDDSGTPATFSYFWEQLYPYGDWVQIPSYGWCWSPAVARNTYGWRPYADAGRWVFTDDGWFWQSDYPWGDCTFHYGRWMDYPGYGWVWVPDNVWGPAWVCWRQDEADEVCGWAPLPPGVRFVAGLGLFFNGHLCGDIDFGLGIDAFVFLPYGHLFDHDYRGYFAERDRVGDYFGRSRVRNGYRLEGGRLADDGIGRGRLGELTHHAIEPVAARGVWTQEMTDHRQARVTDVQRVRASAPFAAQQGQMTRSGNSGFRTNFPPASSASSYGAKASSAGRPPAAAHPASSHPAPTQTRSAPPPSSSGSSSSDNKPH
jgi:hypothetical protein